MSIIYNALTKTQRDRAKEQEAPTDAPLKNSSKSIAWLSASVISIGLFVAMIMLYGQQPKMLASAPSETVKNIAKQPSTFNIDEFKNKHTVTGIYLSNREKIALINNKFVHPGETIDGMEVVSIESNRIILRNADNALILPVEHTQSF